MKRIGRPCARTPAELLALLGERIKSKDLDGIVDLQEPEAAIVNFDQSVVRGRAAIRAFYLDWFKLDPVLTVDVLQTEVFGGRRAWWSGEVRGRTATLMGKYTLEQTGPDGARESFDGDFCDTVKEQPNGTWLYLIDNPYPPHQMQDSMPGHEGH